MTVIIIIKAYRRLNLTPLLTLLSPIPSHCSCQLARRMRRALFLHTLWSSLALLFTWPLHALAALWASCWHHTGAHAQGGHTNQGKLKLKLKLTPESSQSSGSPPSLSSSRLFLGHTRFATSSVPSVVETHPHAWSPERRMRVWGVEEGGGGGGARRVRARVRNVGHYITHNGDFEFWNLFGR